MRKKNKVPMILALMAVLMFAVTANCRLVVNAAEGDVAISKTNFPDDAFRSYVSENCDNNKDGYLSAGEISDTTKIYVSSEQISSLEGIEFFTALKHLDCSLNGLSTLDVSKNPLLEILNCSWNQLTDLDLSKNKVLAQLYCYQNKLGSLDVSKNEILSILECSHNKLSALDVSKNIWLGWLVCSENRINSLDLSTNTKLSAFQCEGNVSLMKFVPEGLIVEGLDISRITNIKGATIVGNRIVPDAGAEEITYTYNVNNGNLKNPVFSFVSDMVGAEINETTFPDKVFRDYVALFCDRNQDGLILKDDIRQITEINVETYSNISSLQGIEYFTELKKLNCKNNRITSLDVSRNTALTFLHCGQNNISSLDVSNNMALKELICFDNDLDCLDVSRNTALVELACGEMNLSSLDVSKNILLECLQCSSNKLTSLDVSRNVNLEELQCFNNKLEHLDVSKNPALYNFSCFGNELSTLDVSACVKLEWLSCNNNRLSSLDVSRCTVLDSLMCYGNKLKSLDVSGCNKLTYLDCYENNLSSLDVSECISLVTLNCSDNQIGSLDVSGCRKLSDLSCDNNKLKALKVSGCTKLGYLFCDNNHLAGLDLSDCKALVKMSCKDNAYTMKFKPQGFTVPGLDVERMSNIKGAKIVGKLIVPNKGVKAITYTYDVKNTKVKNPTFKLCAPEHKHTYGKEWKSNAASHWHECVCGEKTDVAEHTLKTTVTPATATKEGKTETRCSVCKKVTETEVIPAVKTVTLSQSVYVYDGKEKNPVVTVKDSKGKKISAKYYTVVKADGRTDVGSYSYKITFKGNYKGTKTLTFVINPKGTKISSLTPASHGFNIKWTKQLKQTTGYEIQYSVHPDMEGAKLVTVNKNTVLTKKVRKLQADTMYYVRVRTYKTVAGKKYYSALSKTGTVKTK